MSTSVSWRAQHEKKMHAVESTCIQMLDKLYDHDGQFEQIQEKLLSHDGQFEQIQEKLLSHDGHFEQIDDKLQEIEEKMLTKDEFYKMMDTFMERLNTMWQEQLFLGGRMERIENSLMKKGII